MSVTSPAEIDRDGSDSRRRLRRRREEAKRHEKASKDYVQGRDVLRQLGPTVEQTIEMVVERDLAPVGFGSLEALRTGLSALSAYWSAKRKAR